MTDSNGFADHDRIDLTKNRNSSTGHDTTPLPPYPAPSATPDLPPAGSDYWQPHDPYVDPLSALDQAYPPYPVAYSPTPYPAGQFGQGGYYANPYLMAPQQMTVPPRTNGMATGALICSLVAFPAMFFCLAGVLIAPVSVALGIIGLNQIKQRPYENGTTQAWVGIALGGFLTLLCIALAAAWVVVIAG